MYERLFTYKSKNRSLSVDSSLEGRSDKKWRIHHNGIFENKYPSDLDEHEFRTKERLRKLSRNLRINSDGSISNDSLNLDKFRLEQILLYINTGGKYNNDIYRKRDFYKEMILDIYEVGGYSYEVMVNSFKNIISNKKINGINMTRMDLLINFLSLVEDLHKNYCDPVVNNLIVRKNIRRDKLREWIDMKLKIKMDDCFVKDGSLNRKNDLIDMEDNKVDILSKNIFNDIKVKERIPSRYGVNRENEDRLYKDNILNFDKSTTYLLNKEKRDKSLNFSRDKYVRDENSEKSNIKRIFESLKQSRRSLDSNESRSNLLDNSGHGLFHLDKNNNIFQNTDSRLSSNFDSKTDSRVLSSNSDSKTDSRILSPNFDLKTDSRKELKLNSGLDDKRIAGLNRLLGKLKEIKSGMNDQVRVSEKIEEKMFIKNLSKLDEINDTNRISENLKNIGNSVVNDLTINEKQDLENNQKIDSMNSVNKINRWELDTPFIKYRDINTDNNLNKILYKDLNRNHLNEPMNEIKEDLRVDNVDEKFPNLNKLTDLNNSANLLNSNFDNQDKVSYTQNTEKNVSEFDSKYLIDEKDMINIENDDELKDDVLLQADNVEDEILQDDNLFENTERHDIHEITSKLEDIVLINERLINKIEDLPIENINNDNFNDLVEPSQTFVKSGKLDEETINSETEKVNVEYFLIEDKELRNKIEEYNYWFDNINTENSYELNLDGLSMDEFYYKNVDLIPKCQEKSIDMSSLSIYNICSIIYDKFPKFFVSKDIEDTENLDARLNKLTILSRKEIREEVLLSFIHDEVMSDPRYLKFTSLVKKGLSPPDDNYILLIMDIMMEVLRESKTFVSNEFLDKIDFDIISKKVIEILQRSYEPYLSEVDVENWILKKMFHPPHYPNILESEKEFLNIEHLFKYHLCEDYITNDYINLERAEWLKISKYYLPLLNEITEQILQEIINETLFTSKLAENHLVSNSSN